MRVTYNFIDNVDYINSEKLTIHSFKSLNDEIKKLVSRMPFLIDDYTEEEKRTELVCVEMGYYLTEHYVYNPRNEKEKKQCVNLILSTPFRNKIYDVQLWLESIILEGPVLRKNFVRLIELIENEILVRTDN